MALDLKKLGVRSLSAVVFVIVLLGSLIWSYYSFIIFFFAVAVLALLEFYKIGKQIGFEPFQGAGILTGIVTYVHFALTSAFTPLVKTDLLTVPLLGSFIILAAGMLSRKTNSMKNAFFTLGGVVYAVLPFALLNYCVWDQAGINDHQFQPQKLLGVILLIWSNDTFAYLGGSLLGRHKMIERISPGKTWEGTAIGVLITFALSFLFGNYLIELKVNGNMDLWPVLGLLVPVLATIGDLVESKLKREAGIKDSGNIMPGHGGILDRFDSLIFVSPFVFALIS
jgi:phosphatidate cytidylyltransferase